MKKILLITIFTTALFSANLTIEVTNILNTNGVISIGVYNTDESFATKGKEVVGVKVDAVKGSVKYSFKDLPDGTYGISLFHDENKNGELDKNFLGIPSEGYGLSNNVRPSFRGANFKESKFELNSNKNLVINIGY